MKKIALVILIAVFSIVSVFAVPAELLSPTYSAVAKPYTPMSARMLGMGSAGIAIPGRSDAFFINPAALGAGHFELSLPYVQFTLYHPYDLIGKEPAV